MKRLAALAVIMMFVVSSTGCRRGLRLFGLRGAPCQAAPTAPAFGGSGLMGQGQGPMMGAPMPTTTCCPPACPPIDCGCATGAIDPGYAGLDGGGMNGHILSDTGMPLQPGETLADIGPSTEVLGTASAPAPSPSPFSPAPSGAMAPGLPPMP